MTPNNRALVSKAAAAASTCVSCSSDNTKMRRSDGGDDADEWIAEQPDIWAAALLRSLVDTDCERVGRDREYVHDDGRQHDGRRQDDARVRPRWALPRRASSHKQTSASGLAAGQCASVSTRRTH